MAHHREHNAALLHAMRACSGLLQQLGWCLIGCRPFITKATLLMHTPMSLATTPTKHLVCHLLQASSAQQARGAAAPKPADVVRSATRQLQGVSHTSDAMSDASGSAASTSSATCSYGSMPVNSPGGVLRAANSILSEQHAISEYLRTLGPLVARSG